MLFSEQPDNDKMALRQVYDNKNDIALQSLHASGVILKIQHVMAKRSVCASNKYISRFDMQGKHGHTRVAYRMSTCGADGSSLSSLARAHAEHA